MNVSVMWSDRVRQRHALDESILDLDKSVVTGGSSAWYLVSTLAMTKNGK